MVALVGAMFVAMGSVSAQTALGMCKTDGPTLMGIGDSCTYTSNGTTAEATGTGIVDVSTDGTIAASAVGASTVSVPAAREDDDGTEEHDESVAQTFSIDVRKIAVTKIEFGALTQSVDADGSPTTSDDYTDDTFIADNDNVFSAGTEIAVRVTVSYSTTDTPAVTVSVPTTGLSLDAGTSGTTQRQRVSGGTSTTTTRDSDKVTVVFQGGHTLLTDGAPTGEYTITVQADNGQAAATTSAKSTAKLRIGDAGNMVDDATLELGLKEGPADDDATNDEQESGSVARDGSINLNLSVTNGIDNPVNAADVDEIRVVAPFGVVKYYTGTTMTDGHSNEVDPSALMKGSVVINVASSGETARMIDVYAIVLGKAGVATTGTVSLSFTGDAASVGLEDATENLRSINLTDEMDSIKLMVTAADSSGNSASVPDALTIMVHDPDGKQLPTGNDQKLNAEQMSEAGKTYVKVTNRSGNDAGTALKAGDYTVKVKSGTIEDSAMFTVVGTADSIDVEVGETNDNGEFVVTVTAKDAAGELVADGTTVKVEAPDLRGDADKVLFLARSDGKTTAGMAKAKLVEIGPGNAAIVVTVDGVTKVERYTSTYGAEEEAITEPEMVGNHCIENKGGFAVWTCGVSAMASEVFALAQPEGATAIHLWSTISMSWVRYSVVDGAMVPGSSDFMVTKSDILYISN